MLFKYWVSQKGLVVHKFKSSIWHNNSLENVCLQAGRVYTNLVCHLDLIFQIRSETKNECIMTKIVMTLWLDYLWKWSAQWLSGRAYHNNSKHRPSGSRYSEFHGWEARSSDGRSSVLYILLMLCVIRQNESELEKYKISVFMFIVCINFRPLPRWNPHQN